MLKKIVLALAVLIVGFGAVVASRPATFRVERSATMAAPADIPFAMVNDFHRWHYWSPWAHIDPKMSVVYDGPIAGTGATYTWSGNKEVGKGKMAILETNLYSSIRIQLDFIEPFPSNNITTFSFEPTPEGTKVSWVMEGNNTFMTKAFGLFVDMDKMVGADFEKGLASMKALAEPEAQKRLEAQARAKAAEEAKAAAAAQPPAPEQPAQAGAPAP